MIDKNMKALKILKSRFASHSPLVLTHLVTSLCNCKCKTCDLWKKNDEYKEDLTVAEVFKMLDDARDAGMIGYVAWGGEPLMRKELPEFLRHSRENGMFTVVITNGSLLAERCDEIAAHTDLIIVSLDSHDGLHDEMRGLNGIRLKAINGIRQCKKLKMRVMINTVVSRLNLDKTDEMVKLSGDLGVPIAFEPLNVYPGYNEHLKPSDAEINIVFSRLIKYKQSGYKIANSTRYLQIIGSEYSNKKPYACHAPKVYVEVSPRGDIACCLGKPWANVKNVSFERLFKSKEYIDFCERTEKCNKCVVSCVIESSLAYSIDPMFLLDKVRSMS